eukprot:TRINITY_DN5522_c0_g2_i3.p1 TRINITY_DN5522_c0_g2~~TRINITY_DN5522_c0_g2_i3.p1  ORF type:complete len:481 (-),score=118.42 TRINITY_DN5522_c0_g2_i3:122-1564(-)
MRIFALILLSFCFVSLVEGRTKEEWRNRTIYQLLTDRFARTDGSTDPCADLSQYCGGTYQGIIKNLDYIAGMGFDAIWISPVVENTPTGYHGYFMSNLYKLNPNFGTEEDFLQLIDECHRRNIWVMVDVVANHVTSEITGGDYSKVIPFNDSSYYHDYCQITEDDFLHNQSRVENCWLFTLPDLNQSIPFVRRTLINWIRNFVNAYKIDGLRIDTVPYVPKDFWAEFSNAAGIFSIGEVTEARYEYQGGYQPVLPSVLNYMLYYRIIDVFVKKTSMTDLKDHFKLIQDNFQDPTVLGNFVDNHDQPRLLSQVNDVNLWKNALILSVLTPGIPIVYAGGEQGFNGSGDPNNREPVWTSMNPKSALYKFVSTIVGFRKSQKTWTLQPQNPIYADVCYLYTLGNALIGITNSAFDIQVQTGNHPFNVGDTACNILAPNKNPECITVDKDGSILIEFTDGSPKIFLLKSQFLAHKLRAFRDSHK